MVLSAPRALRSGALRLPPPQRRSTDCTADTAKEIWRETGRIQKVLQVCLDLHRALVMGQLPRESRSPAPQETWHRARVASASPSAVSAAPAQAVRRARAKPHSLWQQNPLGSVFVRTL